LPALKLYIFTLFGSDTNMITNAINLSYHLLLPQTHMAMHRLSINLCHRPSLPLITDNQRLSL